MRDQVHAASNESGAILVRGAHHAALRVRVVVLDAHIAKSITALFFFFVPPQTLRQATRAGMSVQPLAALESKYNEPPEGGNRSGMGLVRRARMPLTLNPR